MKGVSGDTPLTLCPYLTNLSFTNLVLKKSALQALSTAMSDGKLPRLSHLTFKDCRRLNGRLSILFALPWPNIIYLNMCGTQVSFSDLGVLFRTGTDVDNLPSLTSLELCAVKLSCRKYFHFKLTMSKVTDLILSNELLFGYNFLESINQGLLPNLKTLGLHIPSSNLIKNLRCDSVKCLEHLQLPVIKASDLLEKGFITCHPPVTWQSLSQSEAFPPLSLGWPQPIRDFPTSEPGMLQRHNTKVI